jgi:hypothetical protein
VNCVDAEQMWWYLHDGIFKKTGVGIILSYETRSYITSERRCTSNLCRIVVNKNRFGFGTSVDYVHFERAIESDDSSPLNADNVIGV